MKTVLLFLSLLFTTSLLQAQTFSFSVDTITYLYTEWTPESGNHVIDKAYTSEKSVEVSIDTKKETIKLKTGGDLYYFDNFTFLEKLESGKKKYYRYSANLEDETVYIIIPVQINKVTDKKINKNPEFGVSFFFYESSFLFICEKRP